MLRRTKAKIKALLSESESPTAASGGAAYEIIAVVNEQVMALPQTRIKIEKTKAEIEQDGLLPGAQFADFLGQYNRLIEAGPKEAENLAKQKKEHQFLCDFADLARSFLKECDRLPPTLAPLLKRHFYRFISILNSKDSAKIFEYKKGLPRVGLCYFPNPGPRQFVIDALAGTADIVDMEPGKLVELVWKIKGYNFDFGQYQTTLFQRIEKEIDNFESAFVARFPSRQWLIKEMAAAVQYQWALVELLKEKYFDVIFIGANETPLGLALYDMPAEIMPPLVALCHGIPSGDPIMGFFTRMDKVLIRCEPEKEFYSALGVPEARMLEIGSASAEDFPSQNSLQHARLNARYALGLDDQDQVILYATTYDLSIYKTKSCAQIMDLMIQSFSRCVSDLGLKNPVLYIKYHPSPASDPMFSYSRAQYPLQAFARLTELGYRVRLADSIESVLAACDCIVTHESSTLTDALDWGIPTISIKMHNGLSRPLLGNRAYSETDCHKHFSVYDTAETIAADLKALITLDKNLVYKQSKQLWQAYFGSGRTSGLMKVAQLVSELTENQLLR